MTIGFDPAAWVERLREVNRDSQFEAAAKAMIEIAMSNLQRKLERPDSLSVDEAELEKLFDLRHKADMRAIKRWQEATGKTLTWPDHADLCVWLLERNDELQASIDKREP